MDSSATLPNFIYIGPDKAGSSWLHSVLLQHPQAFVTPAKDLYFFDRFYDRGADWYADQFRGAGPQHKVVGEVCPDYLACEDAPRRMQGVVGDAKLMVTLREPASRAFSSYLYMRKHGEGPTTFRAALRSFPDLVEHGRYATQLERYQKYFDREQIYVALFDDLKANPQSFLDDLTTWLQLDRLTLDEESLEARLPASKARAAHIAYAVRRCADFARRRDHAELVGRVKRSALVHSILYRPLGASAPKMAPEDMEHVRRLLADEIIALERAYGLPIRQRWGWH